MFIKRQLQLVNLNKLNYKLNALDKQSQHNTCKKQKMHMQVEGRNEREVLHI